MQDNKTYKIEVSPKTVIYTTLFILFLTLLWVLKNLVLSLFVAFIIVSAVRPLTSFFVKKGVPRRLAVIGIFITIIFLFVFMLVWVIPPFVQETALLIKHLPAMIKSLDPLIGGYINVDSFSQYAPNITNQVFNIIRMVFSNVMFVVTTLFFSFYLTLEEDFIKNALGYFLSERDALRAAILLEKTEKRLGRWLLGEFTLMVVIGCMTYLGLTILGFRYALPLSIIAGLLEAVPNIGPIFSTVPAFIVGVTQAPLLGLVAIVLYFVVQQLENHLIVPYVMKKAVGLSPIVTLIALIIGGQLFGVLGMILAIPFALFLETLLTEIKKQGKEHGNNSVNLR
ncbi:AI-2E family transporter [Candidatus Roizmanbacteria bacterium]|nr:AI-2E family transporter [Candidatus Roizmanbacteria bacterium]